MNGLERGPDLKKKDITALYMCVFPSLLGFKFSEMPISTLKWDIGLFLVSLSSPGMNPWKHFIAYMKEDTSHQYLFPCRSWYHFITGEKLSWLHALQKQILFAFCTHFVSEKPSISKQSLIICLMKHPRRHPRMIALLDGISVRMY